MKLLIGSLALMAFIVSGCPLPEMGGEGQPCFDPPDPCNQGLVCRPIDELCIYPECTPADPDCGAGKYCDFNEYACKTGGEGCQTHEDCPGGYFCDLTDHQCKPEGGGGQVGDPCFFENPDDEYPPLHPDAGDCMAGLECIGWFPSPDNGLCGEPHDCWWVALETNPGCVNDHCGGAMCMEYCGAGRTCPPGFWDMDTVGGECFCSREIEDRQCNPVQDTVCPMGEKCMPLVLDGGVLTVCGLEGPMGLGAPCSWLDPGMMCQSRHMCINVDENVTCLELCDARNDHCTTGGCMTWEGQHWGHCPPSG